MKITEVVPIYDTHNLYSEGYGRKIHILNLKTGKCLCGYAPSLYNEIFLDGRPYSNIVEYIAQPDPDRNICQKCKNILIEKLEIE